MLKCFAFRSNDAGPRLEPSASSPPRDGSCMSLSKHLHRPSADSLRGTAPNGCVTEALFPFGAKHAQAIEASQFSAQFVQTQPNGLTFRFVDQSLTLFHFVRSASD